MQILSSPIKLRLKKILSRGLDAVDAHAAVGRAFSRDGAALTIGRRRYDLNNYERVVVVGAGKATAPMAQAVEQRLGHWLHSGFIVVKQGYGLPMKRILVAEAGHPVPDRSGQRAAAKLCTMVSALGRRDLLIVLLSVPFLKPVHRGTICRMQRSKCWPHLMLLSYRLKVSLGTPLQVMRATPRFPSLIAVA